MAAGLVILKGVGTCADFLVDCLRVVGKVLGFFLDPVETVL